METKKQPGISSQHLEAILASEGRQEDVEEKEVGMEDNETVSKNLPKKVQCQKMFILAAPIHTFVIISTYNT